MNLSMSDNNSRSVRVFHGRWLPVSATPVGYAALIERYDLPVPLPPRLAAVADRHQRVELDEWLILTPRHHPQETLGGHLEFALKWEGIDLGVLSKLFFNIQQEEIEAVVLTKPTGAYTRRLWFLYEWLTKRKLQIDDLGKIKSVTVVDPKHQFGLSRGVLSTRHKVIDNLPGPPEFCPLVRRTPMLARYQQQRFDEQARTVLGRTHPDIIARAAAFLLLNDSRSSFRIEGEQPSADRAMRWGQAIAHAGAVQLSIEELERLQRIVIGDARFVHLGLRDEGGFIGEHDRLTQEPIPKHISARHEDLPQLLNGIIQFSERATTRGMDPVISAASVAFGFVYIHPFEDGNGRLHRWLIHHSLATAGYNPANVVFPISASILRHIPDYKQVLESYSKPLLPFIQWRSTEDNNVAVLNNTQEYYSFFDATAHAEFLYERVRDTVQFDLPAEVAYLEAYDRFIEGVQRMVDMPSRRLSLLHSFLRQGRGAISKRARENEFAELSEEEVLQIEELFIGLFKSVPGVL